MAQLPIGSSGQQITVINGKYRLVRRLGGGSFGDIYLGAYIPTNEQVAIKFEKHGAHCPQLRHEYKVYRELQHCTGVGKVHFFGQHDCFNVMVMELLG
jgi:serine/threonine protein kinase